MNIDEMPAGREMDALVAEKVMGWNHIHDRAVRLMGLPPEATVMWGEDVCPHLLPILSYSTDIANAWRIVETLATEGYLTSVAWEPGRDGRSYASVQMILDRNLIADLVLNNPREMDGRGRTAPLAICRAALKLMESK